MTSPSVWSATKFGQAVFVWAWLTLLSLWLFLITLCAARSTILVYSSVWLLKKKSGGANILCTASEWRLCCVWLQLSFTQLWDLHATIPSFCIRRWLALICRVVVCSFLLSFYYTVSVCSKRPAPFAFMSIHTARTRTRLLKLWFGCWRFNQSFSFRPNTYKTLRWSSFCKQ